MSTVPDPVPSPMPHAEPPAPAEVAGPAAPADALWSMLLAIPLITIAKVVADHIEGLEVVAEFLGE